MKEDDLMYPSSWQDLMNGIYEASAGLFVTLSILRLHKDKKVSGVSPVSVLFFTSWGYWNLYYYFHLHQYISWIGGVSVVVMNTLWLAQMGYYIHKGKNRE